MISRNPQPTPITTHHADLARVAGSLSDPPGSKPPIGNVRLASGARWTVPRLWWATVIHQPLPNKPSTGATVKVPPVRKPVQRVLPAGAIYRPRMIAAWAGTAGGLQVT